MRKSHKLIPAVMAALASSQAYAFVAYEGFDYAAGTGLTNVSTASPPVYSGLVNPFGPVWHATGNSTTDNIVVTSPGLSGPAWLGGTGNSAEWAGPTAGANHARLDLGPFAGPGAGGLQQTIYYSLSLNITDVAVLNPSTSVAGYIIGGFNTITGPQAGSVGVIGTRLLARVHPNDATKYQIGMAKNSNDVVWDPAQHSVNVQQFIVGSYTLRNGGGDGDDLSELWINPDPATTFGALTAPAATLATASGADLGINKIESFVLRQSGPVGSGASNTGIRADELRIDTTWAGVAPGEPNVWTGGDGSWSDSARWSTAVVPDAAGKFVRFGPAAAATNVTIHGPHTAGTLHFNSTNSYTLGPAGGGTLTLDGSSSIVVFDGDHVIDAPVHAAGNLTATVATGKSIALRNLTMTPAATLTKSGMGKLSVADNVRIDRLAVLAGELELVAGSTGPDGVSVVNRLDLPSFHVQDIIRPLGYTFDPGPRATLDIKDNKVIVHAGTLGTQSGGIYSDMQGLVQRAYNFGSWDATGIKTSMPDALAGIATVGVATGEQIRGLGPTDTDTWAGQTINGASVILMYTYAGDANLDGQVDAGDYGILDAFIQIAGADGYANGDFNYDGFIDPADYGTIDNSIQFQGPPIYTGGAVVAGLTAVPEPAAALRLVCAAAVGGCRRRRRCANSA